MRLLNTLLYMFFIPSLPMIHPIMTKRGVIQSDTCRDEPRTMPSDGSILLRRTKVIGVRI